MENQQAIGQDFKHVIAGDKEDRDLPLGYFFDYPLQWGIRNNDGTENTYDSVQIDTFEMLMLTDRAVVFNTVEGAFYKDGSEKVEAELIKSTLLEPFEQELMRKMSTDKEGKPSRVTYFVLNSKFAQNAVFFNMWNCKDLMPKITFSKLKEAVNFALMLDLVQYQHIESEEDPNAIECLKYKNKTLIMAVENINSTLWKDCWAYENHAATSIRAAFTGLGDIVKGRKFALFTPNALWSYAGSYYFNDTQRHDELIDRTK